MEFSKYTNKNIEEIFQDLKTSESGLSEKEAQNRLQIYGFNETREKGVKTAEIFLRQFKSPFFYLLFISAVLALLIGEKVDGIVILSFVLVNVSLGFLQEFRAERAISLLKRYIPQVVRVVRDGVEKNLEKKSLVPGDIVLLEAGNIIPADLRVLKIENFLIDESILTGESVPLSKISQALTKESKEIFEAKNILFAGTLVISGRAEGIVISTGQNTVLGGITKLVSGIKRESAYEKELLQFSQLILRIVVTTITLLFLANLIIHGIKNFLDFLIFCIALIVSILPEALPVVVTFALSEGALRMAREKVVIKRLSAIEDLGNIEILCSDKTGTLTKNKLFLEETISPNKEKCLLYGLLTSSYITEEIESSLNPFDSALFEKATFKIRDSLKKFKLISETPFDVFRLRNSALFKDYNPPTTLPAKGWAPENGNLILIVKGAPETILKLSSNFEDNLNRDQIEKDIKRKGEEGKIILAVAFRKQNLKSFSKEDEKNLTFLGYFVFRDPLKDTAKEAIQLADKLGVKIKIITGDTKEVAGFVAKETGLIDDPKKVILGEELDSLKNSEFDKACESFSVFARVSPDTKHKIVESLQKKYEVGFMGEGINDAPAIKTANVGIVVQEASDVAREVADVVLLEKDLRVVVNGIKEGRTIFHNINKYIKCALASNFGNFYSIAAISLFIPFLPMLPVQILLGNLLSDFPLISIATDYIDIEELKRPKLYQINQVISLIICLALVSTFFDFIFFSIFFKKSSGIIQTLWFIESILTEISLIFLVRTRHFFLKTNRPSIPLIFFTVLDAIIIVLLPFSNFGQKAFHFVAPPLPGLLTVFFLVFNYFIVSEIVKLIYFRYQRLNNKK